MDHESRIISIIGRGLEKGETFREIADYLNARGLYNNTGGQWGKDSLNMFWHRRLRPSEVVHRLDTAANILRVELHALGVIAASGHARADEARECLRVFTEARERGETVEQAVKDSKVAGTRVRRESK